MNWILVTAQGSLAVQVLSGLLTIAGFFLPDKDGSQVRKDLFSVLLLETGAQIAEFVWYAAAVYKEGRLPTTTRYWDWAVSTPCMLTSTALFFLHRQSQSLDSLFLAPEYYAMLACNWLMLLCGYRAERLMEAGSALLETPVPALLWFGSAFFVAAFVLLATFLEEDGVSTVLFYAMYAVWGGYGVAALLPYVPKNVAYNSLDILAKNFYGVFLFFYILLA